MDKNYRHVSHQSAGRAGHRNNGKVSNNQQTNMHLTPDIWKSGTSHNLHRHWYTISTCQPTPDNLYNKQLWSIGRTLDNQNQHPTTNSQQPKGRKYSHPRLCATTSTTFPVNASFVTNLKPITTERQRHYISFIDTSSLIVYKPEFDNQKPTRPLLSTS
jgi:hypothetical protein